MTIDLNYDFLSCYQNGRQALSNIGSIQDFPNQYDHSMQSYLFYLVVLVCSPCLYPKTGEKTNVFSIFFSTSLGCNMTP